MAVGNRLAMMTEAKMALEKTVVTIREETKQSNDVRIARTCCPDPPLAEVRENVDPAIIVIYKFLGE